MDRVWTKGERPIYFDRGAQDFGEVEGRLESPSGDYFDGNALGLYDPVDIAIRNVWIILACAVALAVLAGIISLFQTPSYEASIKLLVGQEGGQETPTSNLNNDVSGLQQLTETMVEAVATRPVAEETINRLGLDTTPEALIENLDARQLGGSQFVEVSYRDSSPQQSQEVANTVGEVFSGRISQLNVSASPITVNLWERAGVPDEAVAPNISRNVTLGFALGLMLGLVAAFARELLSRGWRSPEEAEQITGVVVLGVVPRFEVSSKKGKKG